MGSCPQQVGFRPERMPVGTHPGGMQTITAAEGLASEDLWAVFSALRLLDDAAAAVGDAAVEAGRLVDDARWENQGVRALRLVLDDVRRTLAWEHTQLMLLRSRIAREVM